MKYHIVQKALETFVKTNWTVTAIQYDNVAFNSEIYTQYISCNIVFGEGVSRTITRGCYRQFGLLIITIYTKSSTGSNNRLTLAAAVVTMLTHKEVPPITPDTTPIVSLKVPSLHSDNSEKSGWVRTQVSCPFYYDLEF